MSTMARRNPSAAVAIATGVTVAVVASVAGYVVHRRRRRREALAPIDTVATPAGTVDPPRGGEERPDEPAPAPTPTGSLPDIILAGGVPLEPGWETVAWYRYPPTGGVALWIRVDQYGVPQWNEWSSSDMHTVFEEDVDTPFRDPETGGPITHGHFGRIEGAWRWTVIGGEATPIATELLEGAYLFRRPILYRRYDRESLENGMLDYAAQRAADWIDTAYDL